MSVLEQTMPDGMGKQGNATPRGAGYKIIRWVVITLTAAALVGLGVWGLRRAFATDISGPVGDPLVSTTAQRAPESIPAVAPPTTIAGPESSARTDAGSSANSASSGELIAPAARATTASLVVIASVNGVELYDSPDGALTVTYAAGTTLSAVGRSDDGSWLYVVRDSRSGWAPAEQVIAFDTGSLPVRAPGATATSAEQTPDSTPVQAGGQVPVSVSGSVAEAAIVLPVQTEGAVATVAATVAATSADISPVISEELPSINVTVILDESRLNVRAGPGADYAIVAKAYPQQVFTGLGRNTSSDWIQIQLDNRGTNRVTDTGDDFGWVSAAYVRLSDASNDLPISSAVSSSPAYQEATSAAPAGAAQNPIVQTGSTGAAGLNGTLIIQASNGGLIYAYDLETDALWPLTYGFDPAISPDGSTVAFTRDSGENGLYLIDIGSPDNAAANNERLVFSGRAGLRAPTWSPDGNWIAFSRADEFEECWLVGRSCVTTKPPSGDAVVSRDYDHSLAVVDINGQNYHDLAALLSAQAPDWNTAGIVYQSEAGLQITDDIPNVVNRLVAFNYLKPFYQDPDWQPNGGQIVFQSKEASHWEIFIVSPDGSGMAALTRPATTLVDVLPSNVSPAWSPDGAHIVFVSNRDTGDEAGAWRLWVMDADGSNQHPLPIDVGIEYSFGNEQMVSWGL